MSIFTWDTPWHRWFAWRPVPTDAGMRWLTIVERRCGHVLYGKHIAEFRVIAASNSPEAG